MPEFEAVREDKENLIRRGELGAACAAYHRSVKVVDLRCGAPARSRQDCPRDLPPATGQSRSKAARIASVSGVSW